MSHPTKQPKTRITTAIRFSAETHRRLNEAAEERELSVNWLVCRAVEQFLDRLIPVNELRLTRD